MKTLCALSVTPEKLRALAMVTPPPRILRAPPADEPEAEMCPCPIPGDTKGTISALDTSTDVASESFASLGRIPLAAIQPFCQ